MDPPLQFLSKTGWGIWKTVSRSCNLWHCSQSESVHAVFQLHLNKYMLLRENINWNLYFKVHFLSLIMHILILYLLLLKYYQNENIFIIGPTPFLHPVEGKAPFCLNIFLEKGFKMIYMWSIYFFRILMIMDAMSKFDNPSYMNRFSN